MKIRLLSLLAALCIVCMGGTAVAEVKEFKKFSADVPSGWTSNESGNEMGSMVLLMAPENKCVVTIALQPSGGMPAKDLATMSSQALKGEAPVKVDGSEAYSFTATINGMKTTTRVQENEGTVLVFTVAGDEGANKDAVESIWKSMDSKDDKVKNLLKK